MLARLDPPKAYLPEEPGEAMARPRPSAGIRPLQERNQPGGARQRAALASGVLGIVMIVLLLLNFPLVITLSNMNVGVLTLFVWYGLTGIAFIGSIVGICLAVYSRLHGHWGITGLVMGILDLLWSLGFLVLGMFL